MTGELQVQENARRFATTRDTRVRENTNALLSDVETALAEIADERRRGELTREEALDQSRGVLASAEVMLAALTAVVEAVAQ